MIAFDALKMLWDAFNFLWTEKNSFELLMIGLIFYVILGVASFSMYFQTPEEKAAILSLSNISHVQIQFKSGYSETVPFKDGKSTIKVTSEKLELDETTNNILYVKQIQH